MVYMAPATRRPRKTVEDYMALPDDVRAELIDGELYVTPAPSRHHQEAIENLHLRLAPHVRDRDLGERPPVSAGRASALRGRRPAGSDLRLEGQRWDSPGLDPRRPGPPDRGRLPDPCGARSHREAWAVCPKWGPCLLARTSRGSGHRGPPAGGVRVRPRGLLHGRHGPCDPSDPEPGPPVAGGIPLAGPSKARGGEGPAPRREPWWLRLGSGLTGTLRSLNSGALRSRPGV